MDNDSLSSLLSRESETRLNEEFVDEDTFMNCSTSEEEEYVEILMNRETDFGFKKDEPLVFGDEVKCTRLEAINWILKTGAAFGFRDQTAYLSVTYYDRYLLKIPINNNDQLWILRLLSVASLRLAAKMEESEVPKVSKFRFENENFENKFIEKMELLLLNTLEWRLSPITTPFAFLHYFIIRLCQESPPRNILSRISGLIMAALKEINVVENRPSAIAAAATLVALDQKLTKAELELKMNSISCSKSLNIEDVFSCYNLIQKLKIVSEPPDLRPNDALETSSVTNELHSGSSKRHASTTGSDQNYGVKRLR